MRKLLSGIALAALLTACESVEKTKQVTKPTVTTVQQSAKTQRAVQTQQASQYQNPGITNLITSSSGLPTLSTDAGLVVETTPAEYDTVTETVFVQNATTELVMTPAEYETVQETVVVQPQSVEYEIIPGKYEWVEGEIPGQRVEYENVPAKYETVTETVVVQEASTELVSVPAVYETLQDGSVVVKMPASTTERVIPAVTKTETRRVVKTPASTVERIVQNEIKDGKTRLMVEPSSTVEKTIPPVTKQVTRRVIKTPARTVEKVIPAGKREIQRRVMKKPESYVIRDLNGNIVKTFSSADEFAKFQNNPYKRVAETPVSTFSADVDTASYSFVRQYVENGRMPPAGSVRVEEMVNYFDYDFPKPQSLSDPFKPSITVVPSPWNAETRLVHIGVQGFEPPVRERPDMNLVFLIDVSGSMQSANKLPLLKKSFESLVRELRADDTVSIVTYASSERVALEPTSGDKKDVILDAIKMLGAGGSTAGAAGIQKAYELAAENFDDEGTNRVILATDGDFNVGISSQAELKAYISDKRASDIYLSVLGFGMGNLKDNRMQALAQNGNGIAGYIDSLKEARKFFSVDLQKNLIPIANDLKLQVEFNPDKVAEYRLIGYETRALKREDFNNDKIDAGDVGAGHSVTAIYEINPKGTSKQFVDPLRYGQPSGAPRSSFNTEYGFLKIRYKRPGEDTSNLITASISDAGSSGSIDNAPTSTRFATAVAAYGLKLRKDYFMGDMDWEEVTKLALNAKGLDENGYRAEFVDLTRSAQVLQE